MAYLRRTAYPRRSARRGLALLLAVASILVSGCASDEGDRVLNEAERVASWSQAQAFLSELRDATAPGSTPSPGDPTNGDGAPGEDDSAESEVGGRPNADTLQAWRVNELGVIPVLMFHRVTDDPGIYDMSPEEFRAELVAWAEAGYVPVRMDEVIDGRIDVPLGMSPVVLTFDDSSSSQVRYLSDGRIDPSSALGILLDVARQYPRFRATATFYVISDLFGTPGQRGQQKLHDLHRLGFELGNHTFSHANLARLPAADVARELALGAQLIRDAAPGAQVRTLAVPFGLMPQDPQLAVQGSYGDIAYRHDAVLLAGSSPMPSPFADRFDPLAVPRIRPNLFVNDEGPPNLGSAYWRERLAAEPWLRYVSDGDPDTIAFPRERADDLAPQFGDLARPY